MSTHSGSPEHRIESVITTVEIVCPNVKKGANKNSNKYLFSVKVKCIKWVMCQSKVNIFT